MVTFGDSIPMRTQSRDTHPEIERRQIEMLRQASVARRFQRARSLTQTTFQLALRALRRQHPEMTPNELFVRFVALHYGDTLAEGLRRDLLRRELL